MGGGCFEVGTHKGTGPCDYSLQQVPWRVYAKGLVAGTCPTNGSHEAFWGPSCRDLSQKIKLVWICGTSCRGKSWSMRLHFDAKMASSQDGTSPCDLLQGLVPSCVLTLYRGSSGVIPFNVSRFLWPFGEEIDSTTGCIWYTFIRSLSLNQHIDYVKTVCKVLGIFSKSTTIV